ncbi:hypothetical protein NDU88_001860 [Pleurodeles waltl]|uniref:Transmembrane protein 70 n=1 Tax=Pleurodeles waltl TaxID=8319 RepID=A0AAV7UUJ0_PLEWA|nr:hypothetical protein NDU88_001860 [Pleurodeles waltl]
MNLAAAEVALRCRLGQVYAWLYSCRTAGVPSTGFKRDTERGSICHASLRGSEHPLLFQLGARRKQRQIPVSCVNYLRNFTTSSSSVSREYGRLVYVGNLARAVLGVKFFSYSTSIFSLCVMPYVMFKSGVGADSVALQMAFYSIMGFFTFVTPVTLHLLTKGYVVRLYHKPDTDTYTAVTYNMFLAEKRTVFHQQDVRVPGVSKMFTTFYARSKSMLVNPMLFNNPQEYSHLMGYDKPFTFDFEELKESEDHK